MMPALFPTVSRPRVPRPAKAAPQAAPHDGWTSLQRRLRRSGLSETDQNAVLLTAAVARGERRPIGWAAARALAYGMPTDDVRALREGRPTGDARRDALAAFTHRVATAGAHDELHLDALALSGLPEGVAVDVMVGVAMVRAMKAA